MSTVEKQAAKGSFLQDELDVVKETLRTFFSHSRDGILLVDAATDEILDVNSQACEMLRRQKSLLLGTKLSQIFSSEWQSDYTKSLGVKLLKNADHFQMSAVLANPEGQRLPVELLAALVETSGTRRIHVILRDVSKERRLQGQLKSQASLLQNVDDAIISVDTSGTILFLNKKAENLYGTNAEDAICRLLYEVIRYEFLSPAQEQECRGEIEEKGFWRGEVIHHDRDGHPIDIESSVSVVNDDQGRPSGFVTVNRDITARKEAERKLKRRGDEMAALYEIGQAISTHLNLKDVLSVIHKQIARLMRARNFYVSLYDETNQEIHFPIYIDEMVCKDGTSRKARKGYTEYVIQTGKPLLLSKETEGQMERDGYKGIGPQALSWLGVPLQLRHKVIGMMAVQSYTMSGLYNEDDVRILSAISDQAAIAIENARMFEQVRLSEETYRNLIESMNEGYVVIQNGKIAFANQTFAELSAYCKGELLGRGFDELFADGSHEALDKLHRNNTAEPEKEALTQFTLLTKSGAQLRLDFKFRNLCYNGAPALVGICHKTQIGPADASRVSMNTDTR